MEKNNQGTREANSLGQNPLGVAPMGGLIAKFAIPAIISMLVSAMYNIVDQIFIGQGVGMLGNAATNVAFPVTTIATALALLLGIGGASNYNLEMGAGREKKASGIAGTALSSLVISGVILAVIVLVSRKIIHSVYQPLNLLTESMKTVEQGNFDTKIEYNQKDEFWYIYFGYDWFVVLDDLDTLQQTLVKKVPESDADKNEDRKVLFFRLKYISEHEYIDQHEAQRIQYPPEPVQIGIGYFSFQLGFRRVNGILPVLLHVIPESFKHKIRSYILLMFL